MSGYTFDDLFRLRWPDLPQLSPSGDRLAFVETFADRAADRMRQRAVIVSLAEPSTYPLDLADPTQLAWSPSCRELAVCAADGVWLSSGSRLHRVTDAPASEVAWSPDGVRLAVTFARQEKREVHVVRTDGTGNEPVAIVGESWHPRWSPDGTALAFLTDDGLHVMGASGVQRVRTPAATVAGFAWAPDSTRLACFGRVDVALVDEPLRLWIVDVDGGRAQELVGVPDAALGSAVRGDDPRGTGAPAVCWSAASGRIYVESTLAGRGPLSWFDPDYGTRGLLLDGEHACLSPSVNGAGQLAVVVSGPDDPGEVCAVDEATGRTTRVTGADDECAALAVPTRHAQIASGLHELDAWLTIAPSARPTPLLVNVHGGPYYAVGWRFTFEVQRLAAQGYAVLTLNPRGSLGRGIAFATGIRGDWGGADAADVLAAVDAITARPDIDETRVALWGVSYGGFLTQYLLTRSTRFRAGISENGISDFTALWTTRPDARPFWHLALGGPPSCSPHYAARSPITHAATLRSPLLLIHADDDRTVPVDQSVRMHEAVQSAGGQSDLLRLPGEGHLINLSGRPSSRATRATHLDLWLARTLPR